MPKKNHPDKSDLEASDLSYQQALQYAKDLTRIFKTEKSEREKYEMLFDLSPDGILIVGRGGVIMAANPAIQDMLLQSETPIIIGNNIRNFIPIGEKKNFSAVLKKIINSQSKYERLETGFVGEDGHSFPVEINIGHIQWEEEPAAQIIVRDISEAKLAMEFLEQRVNERTQELALMYAVAAIGNNVQDLKDILENALKIIFESTTSYKGAIHLFNQHNGHLERIASVNIKPKRTDNLELFLLDEAIWEKLLGEKIQIFQSTGPITTKNAEPNTYLGLLIQAEGEPIGLLSLLFEKDHKINSGKLDLYTTVVDQIGIFVQSARLRDRVGKAALLEERNRLARDLHDSVTQLLYSLTLFATASKKKAKAKKWQHVENYLNQISKTATQALKEMRLLIFELRPAILKTSGLLQAIKHRLDFVENRAGIEISLTSENWDEPPENIQLGFYYIVQEALNNVLKHTKATQVSIELKSDASELSVKILDNGGGFEPETNGESGMGLKNMRERAQELGGLLIIESNIGKGTIVTASVEVESSQ